MGWFVALFYGSMPLLLTIGKELTPQGQKNGKRNIEYPCPECRLILN